MKAHEAEAKFKQADTLFRQARYREALELLVELDRAFPNTKRILFPLALSLFHTDCQGEAVQLCDRLIANFDYAKAKDLKARIESGELPGAFMAGAEGPSVPPGTFVPPGKDPPEPMAEPASSSRWPWYVFIGVCVAVLVGLPLVGGLMKDTPPPEPAGDAVSEAATAVESVEATELDGEPDGSAEGSNSTRLALTALAFLISAILGCVAFYFVMAFMGHLLHEDVGSNIVDVVLTQIIMALLGLIPIVGWIFALQYMAKHYDLSCGELIIAILLLAAVNAGITVAIFALLLGGDIPWQAIQGMT